MIRFDGIINGIGDDAKIDVKENGVAGKYIRIESGFDTIHLYLSDTQLRILAQCIRHSQLKKEGDTQC